MSILRANDASCWHHRHHEYGIKEASNRAPCIIMTIREPAKRLESDFRYLNRKNSENISISNQVASFARLYAREHRVGPLLNFFGVSMASYFAGLTPEMSILHRIITILWTSLAHENIVITLVIKLWEIMT